LRHLHRWDGLANDRQFGLESRWSALK